MNHPSQRTIFLEALDQENPDQRERYLNSACGDDQKLRASVDDLLAAHDRPANPLDSAIVERGLNETFISESNETDHVGMVIGDYRLMEQIGEGGFGLVFVAQQDAPVKRKVALKIIKPGTGSKEVLARFDAESQAVAIMDHPNIARVFDAGVTDDSRPYFVMELVRGEPITDFCDRHRLSLRKRLELFQDVCAATHHAHQKGVVHRDLKPSNVMVSLHDDTPIVKVIDFGVAKAIGQNLTDQTIYTRFFSMIGTPLYMSPEQAAMSGLDVDTRSDIYSLGVLLYELLTGTTPFARERLDSAGYDEMRRIIREEEPPKPSTRLTTIDLTAIKTRVAQPESTPGNNPKRETIQSDLDWIVMKALEKDRTRRYESAAAMSTDVKRFLSEEPIEARPPSRRYRLQKFALRNRIAIVTGSLVASALVVGTVVSLYQASIAITERNEKAAALDEKNVALNQAVEARLEVERFATRLKTANVLVGEARNHEDASQFKAAHAVYCEAVDLVPNYYLVWVQRALLRARLHLWDEAAADFAEAIRLEAPLGSREWEGAAALFVLTERTDDYRTIYSRLMTTENTQTSPPKFNSLRSCLIAPANEDDARRLVAETESLLGPQGDQPRGLRNGPGGRDRDREFDGRDQERGFGRDFGRGGPGGGPGDENRAPRSVMEYVAAWANVRAGNNQNALRFLDLAANSRGHSRDMVHSLRAIALHRLERVSEAAETLEIADQALNDAVAGFLDGSNDRRPWIDLLEMVLLHREATEIVTGRVAERPAEILVFQAKTRVSLGL